MVTGLLFTGNLLRLFGVTGSCYAYAWNDMRIILWGIPFYIFTAGMNAAIRADGSPGYSMFAIVLSLSWDVAFLVSGVAILSAYFGVTGGLWAAPVADVLPFLLTIWLIGVEYRAIHRREEEILCTNALSPSAVNLAAAAEALES